MRMFENLAGILTKPERTLCEVPLNWAAIAAAATFWSYGYSGAASFAASGAMRLGGLVASLGFYAIFLTLVLLARHQKAFYSDSLIVRKSDIVALCCFLVLLGYVSLTELSEPLVGDELSHSQQAQIHGIVLIQRLVALGVPIGTWPFSSMLYGLTLASLGGIAWASYVLCRMKFLTRLLVLSVLFWAFRTVVVLAGGGNCPHPPLRTFPLWISSSLISASDFGFRLPQLLGLVLGMWGVQRLTRPRLGPTLSWCFGLAVGTIPVLWHVGTMPEPSIWSALAWTLFLLALETQNDFDTFMWVRWVSILAIATMLRQSAFVGLIPLGILYVFSGRKQSMKVVGLLLAPTLFMLPFLVRSLVTGTPATYFPESGEALHIPLHGSAMARVWYALRTGIAPWAALHSVQLPWVLLPLVAFLPRRSSAGRLIAPALGLFFAMAVFMFFSIRPVLWGVVRYQAEYVVPFAILGLYRLVALSRTGHTPVIRMWITGCVLLVAWNTFAFKHLSRSCRIGTTFHGATIASESVYDYRGALQAARNEHFAGHTYIAGVTYGVLPEIINGYTVKEVMQARAIVLRQLRATEHSRWKEGDPAAIDADSTIRLVLISDDERRQQLVEALRALGWMFWKDFRHERSGAVIYGMLRSKQPEHG